MSDKNTKELEQKIYSLDVENENLREQLSLKFHDKSNQTIAYQFGRLTLDFIQNPIKNRLKVKDLSKIYVDSLKRKSKNTKLSKRQKVILALIEDDESNIQDDNFEKSIQSDSLEESIDVIQNSTELQKKVENIAESIIVQKNEKPFKSLVLDKSDKKKNELKVAVILDEFSFNSFKDEFIAIPVEPSNWKEVFKMELPDLFLCESAWSGIDPEKRPWKGKIYSSINFPKENRKQLLDILKFCKEQGIPTIFWNKEDPTHFDDRIHDFVNTAQLFDFVFTTAIECVQRYRDEYKIKNVYPLQFATQPRMFNPIVNGNRSDDVVFAGSWYQNHKGRSAVMSKIFDSIIEQGYNLKFYNRFYGNEDPNHFIPEKYKMYENPNVQNSKISEVYKSSKYGLNINTVDDSQTMFARRVFELMSSNTLVLSNYSVGIEMTFGSDVIFLDSNPDRLRELSDKEMNEIRERNLTKVLSLHTYEKRYETILQTVGIKYKKESCRVTIIVKINSLPEAEMQMKLFLQRYDEPTYCILFIVSASVPDIDIEQYYTQLNFRNMSVVSESYILNYSERCQSYDFIQTPYFALIQTLEDLEKEALEKALLHSSYLTDKYISLEPRSGNLYTFSDKFQVINIFAHKNYFLETIRNYQREINSPIYNLIQEIR